MALLEHALPLDHPALAPPTLIAVPDPPTSGWPGEVVRAAEESLAAHDYRAACDLLADLDLPYGELRLQFRVHVTRSWAQFSLGEIAAALESLEEARTLSERPELGDVDRAEVLFQIGCCRLQTASVANAVALLTLALDLCNRSIVGCDHLRVRALDWRSRCYQRQRDWEAARSDVELALELAEQLGDRYILAQAYFQASIVTERQSDWRLARFYAEQSQALLEQLGDKAMLSRVLNNLGGLRFLLDDHDAALGCLERAIDLAEARDSAVDVPHPLASLARVQLESGDPAAAESSSRRAIALLSDRGDQLGELGGALLVCARALAAQDQRVTADGLFARRKLPTGRTDPRATSPRCGRRRQTSPSAPATSTKPSHSAAGLWRSSRMSTSRLRRGGDMNTLSKLRLLTLLPVLVLAASTLGHVKFGLGFSGGF